MTVDTSELDALEAEQGRRWEALDAAGATAPESPFYHLLMGVRRYGYVSPDEEYLQGNLRHARYILDSFTAIEHHYAEYKAGVSHFKYEIGEQVIATIFIRRRTSEVVDRQYELGRNGVLSCKYQMDSHGGIWTGEAQLEKMTDDFVEAPLWGLD